MHSVLEIAIKTRVIAIVRGLEPQHMRGLAEALATGGISLVEVTFDQRNRARWHETTDAIRMLSKAFAGRLIPGAGTVMSIEQARMAREAGAQYIVSPNVNRDVIKEAKALCMAAFPGALTPTEIADAYAAGADAVKVFPASVLGPGYIKAVRAPMGHIPLFAVGGVDEKNAADYIRAGAVGVGIGGNIVNKDWIAAGEWDRIAQLAALYREVTAIG